MISALFSAVGQVISGFATALASSVTSITSIFATAGSGGTYELTMVGSLLVCSLGIGLVYWAFRLIRNLCKARG